MEINEVGYKEFTEVVQEPYHTFGLGTFAHLNRQKAESVHYLLFKDSKLRLGLTGGIRENCFYSPFSAPFGGFVFLKGEVRISQIEPGVDLLLRWAAEKNLKGIQITLPPDIYHTGFIGKQANVLFRKGFGIQKLDLNYSFQTKNFDKNYQARLWRNARKNLHIAFENKLGFRLCELTSEKQKAYEIIRANRLTKGFPLRMSWEEIENTIRLIPADFFLCNHEKHGDIASAMVFHVAPKIVQVVYWADLPEYTHLKTMNFLSFRLFEHYKQHGVEIIDVGPSTENSEPNHGLCEFKESLGCDITAKLTFKT